MPAGRPGRGVLPHGPPPGRGARRRDRAAVPEDPAPRRRLQPRPRSGGAPGRRASTWPTSSSARKGRSASSLEAKLRLVELPRAKAVLVVQFDDLLEALAATPAILAHRPVRRRGDGPLHPRQHQAQPRGVAAARLPPAATPAPILHHRVLRRRRRASCRRAWTPWKPTCAGGGLGDHFLRATATAAAQARIWKLRELALGLSMAEKGDAKAISFVEDTAVAPERLRDYIAEFLAGHRPPRHQGRRLRPRLGRLPARPAGHRPEDRGRRPPVRGHRRRGGRPGAASTAAPSPASTATAWCAARSRRRCSAPPSTRRSAS